MTDGPSSAPAEPARSPVPPGSFRLGRIAGIDVLVRTSWIAIAIVIAVLVAPRAEQVAPGIGALAYVAGLAFAVLFYLSILMHEVSHALAALHYGLPVRSISIHFLGGATELDEEARTPWAEFVIAVVGPLTSIAVGVAALGLAQVLTGGLLLLAVQALAVSNLSVGVLNLVPGLPLDGGRVLRAAVWGGGADRDRATVVAAWGGRVASVLVLGYPFLVAHVYDRPFSFVDLVMAGLIASFLWGGASASLHHARLRSRLPALNARTLARRVTVVPEDTPVAEAVRRAQEMQAGGIAVHTADDRITGLVDERALRAMPDERRPWVAVRSISRSLEDELRLPADLTGEDLVKAMTGAPASEYLLIEADGQVFGLLATADVEAAFARG